MVRVVLGIALAIFGCLGFASEVDDFIVKHQWDIFGVVFASILLIGGGLLAFFGLRYLKQRIIVIENALHVLRTHNKIDTGELSHRLLISEVDIRKYILHAQNKGILSRNADIV